MIKGYINACSKVPSLGVGTHNNYMRATHDSYMHAVCNLTATCIP